MALLPSGWCQCLRGFVAVGSMKLRAGFGLKIKGKLQPSFAHNGGLLGNKGTIGFGKSAAGGQRHLRRND